MAESTLSITHVNLMNAVSHLCYGEADYTTLTADERALCDRAVKEGYKQYLYPPSVDGVEEGYEWTFLKPVTTITTEAPLTGDATTGTIEVSSGTLTLSGGDTFSNASTWAVDHGQLVIAGVTYTITSYDSDTQLTVVGDDVAAGEDDWTLYHDGDYDLPDGFGRMISSRMHFQPDDQELPVVVDVGEGKIRALRSAEVEYDTPRVAGLRLKSIGDGLTGQRWQIMFYPTPDAAWTLGYKFEILVDALDDTPTFPVGTMKFAELLTLSCLAKADAIINDEYGIHYQNFLQRLKSDVARDRKQQQKFFGNVGTHGEYEQRPANYAYRPYTLTVNGIIIEA